MKKSGTLIVIGLIVAIAFWCCLITAGCGLIWFVADQDVTPEVDWEVDWIETPVPLPDMDVQGRLPTDAERETANLVQTAGIPARDLVELAQRFRGLPANYAMTLPSEPPDLAVGDRVTFWLHNIETNTFFSATASLEYATPSAYWWIETGYDIPADDLERSARNFEEKTYPTNRRLFGSEWSPGIDGDEHIYIFCGSIPGVGGYYSPPDEYPLEINPYSNLHEMFYINLDNAMPGNDYFDGILAHEFQHMIHWAQDKNEDLWINEGMAELAGQINGYDIGGTAYQFSLEPDTQLTAWAELDVAAPHYGAAYLFMAYVHDRYGDEAVSRLISQPENGIASVEAILPGGASGGRAFNDLFGDWTVATYLDEPKLDDGQYGYDSLRLDELTLAAEHDRYPVEEQAAVHQYAADYIRLEGSGDITIEFTGSTLVSLVGNEAHSGQYQWWSQRGDETNTRLTRSFDLRGLDRATLLAWMWYDLEIDYDYAYAEVSADGGQTWTILANGHTTLYNPSGNSYGPALTGTSGGGGEPVWLQEEFDLSPYAGQEVLVRFEVITDEGLNYRGLCLDDVTIPELGYSHDVENGPDGWQAEGFIQVTAHIPQQFLVQVILEGREPRVERLVLDEKGYGQMVVEDLGGKVKRAVLVVSGISPVTTEWAAYQYRITEQP